MWLFVPLAFKITYMFYMYLPLNFSIWMDPSGFIHSSINVHLECLHFVALMINTYMNILSLSFYFIFTSLGYA
jgi:hypothetical protein